MVGSVPALQGPLVYSTSLERKVVWGKGATRISLPLGAWALSETFCWS